MKRLFFVLSSLWNKPTARLATGFLFCVLTLGLFAPVLPLADPAAIDLGNKFISPCSAHWLGTDALGRDIFSRLIWGIRSSVYTALVATLLTALFGTLWGLVSAAANRQTDELMMRFCDLWMSFPSEVMILAMVGLLGHDVGRSQKRHDSLPLANAARGLNDFMHGCCFALFGRCARPSF